MANALNSNTSSPSGDILLNYFPGSTDKNEAHANAATSIKFGGKTTDKTEKAAKAKEKLQEITSTVSQNTDGLKQFDDVESLVASKKVRITNQATQKALEALVQEARHQITNLQTEAPILEDKESLRRIFTLSAMSVESDDSDLIKLKNDAADVVKKIARQTSRAKIPNEVRNLIFANDGTQFLDGLRKLIRSEGLKSISRGPDGGVGNTLLKMVRGFGPLQEEASIALMTKVDQLLSGSPNQELIEGLDATMKSALYSLRETITKDFEGSSNAAISKKEADLDSMSKADADAARANIKKVIDQRDTITGLFNATSQTEYSKYQTQLVERALDNNAARFEIRSALADIETAKDTLKDIGRGSDSDQTFFQLPTYLLEGAGLDLKLEYFRSVAQNLNLTATKVLGLPEAKSKITTTDIIADIKEQIKNAAAGEITVEGNKTTLEDINSILTTVEASPASPQFKGDKSDTLKNTWDSINDKIKTRLAQEAVNESTTAATAAASKQNKFQDLISKHSTLANLLKKDANGEFEVSTQSFIEGLAGSDTTAIQAGMDDIIKNNGAWSLMLSKQDEQQIERINDILTDAKGRYTQKDSDIRNYEDMEYKILYYPLGKKAETVAAAVRNALSEYMIGQDGEGLSEGARKLYTQKTRNLLSERQTRFLNDAVEAQKQLIEHGGLTKLINNQVTEVQNLVGIADAAAIQNAFNALDKLANPAAGANDQVKRMSSHFTFSREESRVANQNYINTSDADDVKAQKTAAKLALLLNKLNDLSRRTEADSYLKEVFEKDKGNILQEIYDKVVAKQDQVMPKVQRLENATEIVKEQKKVLKELRLEKDAWAKTSPSDTSIFGFSKAGSFIKTSLEYMHSLVTRLFAFTDPNIKQKEQERLTKNLETAKQGLDPENTLDEAILSGIGDAASISEIVRFTKAKEGVDTIRDYSSSARKAA